MTTNEFKKLLTVLINAAFDCGDWRDDNPEHSASYRPVAVACEDARAAVIEAWRKATNDNHNQTPDESGV